MVIGNGLLARRFVSYKNNDRFLVFASGVSNSKTKNPELYKREIALLQKSINDHPEKIFIYFSTCSIYDPDEKKSAYVLHKLNIENIIRASAGQYFIFRVSNVAGTSSNPNTLLNYFHYHIKNGVNFDLWINACRNIIDIDDLFFIADHLLQHATPPAEPVNIASPFNHPVSEIVSAIECFLDTKSNYIEVNKGSCFEIDLSVIRPVLQQSPVQFDNDYLAKLLAKYFNPKSTTQ
ncbi:MAG: NAD(P)-dependent oxidoreductase [Ferruginibacter sp.]|nr:NAD(P)-dependent oxidoreductase [Chitinophagaceae bacterium]